MRYKKWSVYFLMFTNWMKFVLLIEKTFCKLRSILLVFFFFIIASDSLIPHCYILYSVFVFTCIRIKKV